MSPFKSLTGVASWLLRLSFILFIYHRFFGIVMQLNFTGQRFYIAAGFVAFGILLFIGGFARQSITVVAALGLLILSIIELLARFNGIDLHLVQWVTAIALSMFFLAYGNK